MLIVNIFRQVLKGHVESYPRAGDTSITGYLIRNHRAIWRAKHHLGSVDVANGRRSSVAESGVDKQFSKRRKRVDSFRPSERMR